MNPSNPNQFDQIPLDPNLFNPDVNDLNRLIEAIHTTKHQKDDEARGLLSKEWDRSMDQELNELQEAEKNLRSEDTKSEENLNYQPKFRILLGQANLCFIEKKYEEAIPLFEEAVRIEPMCKMAWNNLGAIYQDLNDFEKSCQFRMIGAHLTAKSEHLWKELGAESRQHGLLSQAIYCFSEAIKVGKDDVEAMWDRSYLLYEVGRPRQALLGYLGILKLNPYNPDELPLKLFKAAFDHYQSTLPTPTEEFLQLGFGLDHLRILISLLMKSYPFSINLVQHAYYSNTMRIIKLASRWLQGRADHQSSDYLDWDVLDDDREFDPFRGLRQDSGAYLGICRLKIGDEEEAKVNIIEYSDLFAMIGDTYFESEMFHEALEFYQELADNDSTNNPSVWHKIGQCYRKSDNLEEAAECYEAIVQTDQMDLTAKSQLAEIYELCGRQDDAYAMVDDIIEIRRTARAQGIVLDYDPMSTNSRGLESTSSRAHNPLSIRPTTTHKSMEERRMEELARTERYISSFKRLEEIASKVSVTDDRVTSGLMNEFVRIANPMVEGFRQTPALFPCEITKKFAGVNVAPKKSKKHDSQGNGVAEEPRPETAIQEFRGIRFQDWVRIFVHYAFFCVKVQREDEASEVLHHVMSAPIFRQSATMQQVLRLAYASICYAKGDFVGVIDTIRWLSLRLVYHNEPIRLINALLSQGFQQSMAFANGNLQKWFLRQIKFIDEHVKRFESRTDPNEERIELLVQPQIRDLNSFLDDQVEDEDDSYWKPSKFKPKKSNPVYVITFAEILSATRSFQSAIVHYLRVYESYPKEPLLNLLLGLSYSQRAMQRQTDNRHHQIVQASGFMNQYRNLRSFEHLKEVEYNFGRFFHGIGLTTLAISHYQRVLSLSDIKNEEEDQEVEEEIEDFKGLAAYNLGLIYMTSGSPDLAYELISEYLFV
ncbi:hypothetical protein DFH28DRAFT_1081595 [Melampsora americana]|nr:hypothetical protein DFH28DRAFT_1081595 [Melampsora americana]